MLARTPCRRQAVGVAIALAALTAGSSQAQTNTPPGKRTFLTSLHQEVVMDASPQRIYEILLDSKRFSEFSGEPAEISHEVGGAISMFGGKIVGRNIELVPNQRIVQAWRVERNCNILLIGGPIYETSWSPGVYSRVKFELKGDNAKTKIFLDHTGFPQGHNGNLYDFWMLRFWEPLGRFVSYVWKHGGSLGE